MLNKAAFLYIGADKQNMTKNSHVLYLVPNRPLCPPLFPLCSIVDNLKI